MMKFSQGHWAFLGLTKRSGMELFLAHRKENGIQEPLRWWNDLKTHRHPVFKSILDTIHFNGDSTNTEQLFHLSIYGAVTNWCQQFGLTEEDKGRQEDVDEYTT